MTHPHRDRSRNTAPTRDGARDAVVPRDADSGPVVLIPGGSLGPRALPRAALFGPYGANRGGVQRGVSSMIPAPEWKSVSIDRHRNPAMCVVIVRPRPQSSASGYPVPTMITCCDLADPRRRDRKNRSAIPVDSRTRRRPPDKYYVRGSTRSPDRRARRRWRRDRAGASCARSRRSTPSARWAA